MAVSDARKSANAAGVREVYAVFVKYPRQGGKFKYNRQPFNIVIYNWGNGERASYIELCLGNQFKSRGNVGFETSQVDEAVEQYDGIRFMEPSELNLWPSIGRADM